MLFGLAALLLLAVAPPTAHALGAPADTRSVRAPLSSFRAPLSSFRAAGGPPFPSLSSSLSAPEPPGSADDTARLQTLIASCRANPQACDPKAVGPDPKLPQNQAITLPRDWLRDALTEARDPKNFKDPKDRQTLLDAAETRLRADAAATPAPPPSIARARQQANAILAQREFVHVEQPSWWQKKLALFGLFLNKIFDSMAAFVPRAPWVAPALEALVLALAAAAIVFWVRRVNRQQTLALAASPSASSRLALQQADDWAARARTEAARGDWREAVHCLYWSAIVLLEGERLWRPNRTRTPREYVGLLEPGTPRRDTLALLTRIFERIWYGLRPAGEADFRDASALLDRLRTP